MTRPQRKPEAPDAALVQAPRQPRARSTAWPAFAPSSARILSPWSDSVLRLDASPSTESRLIDLSSIPLPENRSVGGPFASGLTLGQFPHWMDTARAYAAKALNDAAHSHAPVGAAVNGLNHVFRFFAWCVRRRVYKLQALTEADFRDLAQDLRPNGWMSALDIPSRLRAVVDRASENVDLQAALLRRYGGAGFISPEALSREIGCVITPREYPLEFRRAMAQLTATNMRTRRTESNPSPGWSESSFKTAFCALNRLAQIPEPLDRLLFEPYPNARLHARKQGGKADGRTANLPVEEAAKLMALALKWVYQRGPGIIKLVAIWRDTLREYKGKGRAREYALARVREAYRSMRDQYELPDVHLDGLTKYREGTSLVVLVQQMQTAVMTIVAINQARRKNEVLGEGQRPWGLYRGCLQVSDPFVNAFELDIYIEKTWRAWLRMSSNKLVADAIGVLSELRATIFPDEQEIPSDASLSQVRARKLFVLPNHPVLLGEGTAPPQYRFELHSADFFREAGIDERFWRTHTFRRLFALLYMYRFDHPSLQALSEDLCHFDLECTRTYVTDNDMRAQAERIEKVYRLRSDSFPEEELDEARRSYADDVLLAMLTSKEAGGPMTRRVRLWVRRLARQVEFDELSLEEIRGRVREELGKRDFAPDTFRHGVCWATGDRFARRANCGEGGKLHRELACIDVCSSCPHHSTSWAFLENVERDAERLEERAAAAADAAESEAAEQSASHLRALVDLELTLMERYAPCCGPATRGVGES